MNSRLKTLLWQQFGAAIDMLENAIVACPDEIWPDCREMAYHVLFFLDFYLAESADSFAPPPPFTVSEFEENAIAPYTREELLVYLRRSREICRMTIEKMSGDEPRKFPSIEGPLFEVMLYNLRHVQHHAAQLNLILRQKTDSAPRWVRRHA